jgi:ribosomal protein S27E
MKKHKWDITSYGKSKDLTGRNPVFIYMVCKDCSTYAICTMEEAAKNVSSNNCDVVLARKAARRMLV